MSGTRSLPGVRAGARWARPAALLLALVVAVLPAPLARAGDDVGFEIPSPEERGPSPVVLRGSFLRAALPADAAGWGYARFIVHNVDGRARTITCSVGGDRAGSARVARRLEAGASATIYLPMLPTEEGLGIRVVADGVGAWGTHTWNGYSSGRRTWQVLSVDDRERSKAAVEAAFGAGEARLSPGSARLTARKAESARVPAESLPDRWPLLSFADAVVVEGSRPGLAADAQRVLVRAVTAGGLLVVLSSAKLPAGPLRDLVVAGREPAGGGDGGPGTRSGVLGLGRWWSTDLTYEIASASGLNLPEPVVDLFAEVVGAADRRPHQGPPSGVLAARFSDALEVPGVGRLPVRVFFFTILAFALIAGPLTYVLLRRRRRLGAFLVLLPALGIVFSAAILLYGLLSEGTGIRGSVRSLSVLDQRSHEAVTRSGRTLYAAFSPGVLRLDPQTVLLSDDFERSSYAYRWGSGTQALLDLDLTDGVTAAGTALPSRIPITYDVTTVAPARERLRVRALPDGRYEARFAPDFAPAPGARTILLRDRDGGWHVGGRDGPLTPLAAAGVGDAVRDALAAVADLPPPEREAPEDAYDGGYGYGASRGYRTSPTPPPSAPGASARWLRGFLPDTLPPGTYLALFERAPAFDDLGLDVAWKRSVHLVHGLLSAEDFGE